MAEAVLLLTLYHVLLFRQYYGGHPYQLAGGEWLEQGFTSWLHLGRFRLLQRPVDPYYYPDYDALPFLSSYYPPHRFTARWSQCLNLDQAWVLFLGMMASHYWLCSVSVYILATRMGHAPLAAGCAAVTLSSAGYALKPNASITCTACWAMTYFWACLAQSWWGSAISLGLMLLAGYWPLAWIALPVGGFLWLSS